MRRLGGAAVGLACTLASAAAISGDVPAKPDKVIVALAAIELPDDPEFDSPAVARVVALIEDSLRDAGIAIVAPEEFDRAWHARLAEAGGYFDVVTGRPDLAKRRSLRAATLGDVRERSGARAVLQPAIVVVAAPYFDGRASWDGAKESAAASGSGEVPALTLAITVEDLSGRQTASAVAGIQLAAKYGKLSGKYARVDQDKLLADDQRVRDAVTRALAPVLAAIRAEPAPPELEPAPASDVVATPVTPAIGLLPAGARVAALRSLKRRCEEIVVSAEVEARFLALVRAQLESAGWWVLPPEVFEDTLRQAIVDRGGIYDPLTGRGEASVFDAVIVETRRKVAERYAARIVVTPGLFTRIARIDNETATWDGVTDKVAEIGALKKWLATTHGTTRGLSLVLAIEDVGGKLLHTGAGGIQLADRLVRDRFVRVPDDELFGDPERNARAVEAAFAGWTPDDDPAAEAAPPAARAPEAPGPND